MWGTGRALLDGAYAFGWLLLFVATVVISHFDLFGLRQVWRYLLGRPQQKLRFVTPFLIALSAILSTWAGRLSSGAPPR